MLLALHRGLGFLLGFRLLLLAPRAPGEAELIKSVSKALCGSMLTNSSSLELARVGKMITEAACTRLGVAPGERQ